MIDRYTKVCLTVIALSLAVIGFRGLSPVTDAVASNGVQKIAICEADGSRCIDIREVLKIAICDSDKTECANIKRFYGTNSLQISERK